ncbi:hypothetical protein B0T11DRAFT_119967 [Plectosphaerella cucumerina]|uniref:Ankyrin repeat protein n=1 Tax=Plectosphaerella cucumerina TaxID=40658 RepID=A0A8K0TC73_9PEZI|nr:hypothetical protein B0T11DRAFT_119967 [Plectosphaerella cucumerina]
MEVKECLKTLPVGLNGIYYRILSKVPPQHRQAVRSILQWVCFAEHPLRPTELAGLFDKQASKSPSRSAMDSDSDSDSDANSNTALNEASGRGTVSRLRDLLRFCNHFILLVKKFDLDNGDVETVHLVHQSAKDYLTRREKNGESGVDYFRLGKRRAIHMDLGRRCIDILTQMIDTNRQEGIPPTNSIRGPNDKTTEQPKPYSYTPEDYAALCRARHLRHGGDDLDTHAQILRIISQDKASHSVWAWQASPNPLLGMYSFHFHQATRDENASALTKAIALGLSSTVKVLVSGMTVEDYTSIVRSSSGGLLNLALDLRHMRIFEILIEAIGSPALILEPNVIPWLADQKSLEVLHRVLKMTQNPRVTFGAELEYCLHKAVFHDSESIFTLLLDTGADPNLADVAYPLAPALIDGRSLTS